MSLRTKIQIALTILLATASTVTAAYNSSGHWMQFALFLTAVLLTSGFKVALPRGDGSMSLNFPFILYAIICLSPLQVLLLAAISVAAQCRIRVVKIFTAVQIIFNIANTMLASAAAFITYSYLHGLHFALGPALAVASCSYFLVSTVSVAAIIASSNSESTYKLWRKEFVWYLPFYFVGAVLAATASWLGQRFGWSTALLIIPMVYTVYRAYTAQIERLKERQQHLEETQALHLRTIEGLAMAIEAKDQGTHEHLFRVRTYVEEVGRVMKLSEEELKALHTAAFLHDIGKLAVPEHIINKPGKLTPEEFEKMKIHPVVGADILERVRFPYPVVPIVRSHHEWWNGAGYPDGLKGEEIPIGARVLTVVDCFDALVSDRPYRKAMPKEKAMEILKSMSGTQFDPTVVSVLEGIYERLEKAAQKIDLSGFTALNTEVAVTRGIAPGNGFAEENAGPPLDFVQQQEFDLASTRRLEAVEQESQALVDLSLSLGSSLRLNEIIALMATRLRRLVPCDACALFLRQGDSLRAQYIEGEFAKAFNNELISEGQGISGWVAQNGNAILNGNATVEPVYQYKVGQDESLQSALSIPLFDAQKHVFAVLTLYSSKLDSFDRNHLYMLQAMEPKLSIALQNAIQAQHAQSGAMSQEQLLLMEAARI